MGRPPIQRAWVRLLVGELLVGELGSCMLQGTMEKKKREKEPRPPLSPQALASNLSPAIPPYASNKALPPSWATSSTSRSISRSLCQQLEPSE